MPFTGRVGLVTGAGSGLGRLAAVRLARTGAQVALVDVNDAGLAETAATIGSAARVYRCDVTDTDEVTTIVDRVEAELGPIECLIHAAGIMPAGAILETDAVDLLRPMKVNYFGTVNVMTATLPRMVGRGTGDVVMFGSVTGYVGSTNFAAYCSSKAAVNAFGEILINENRKSGLRMVLACPSAVKTPLLGQAIAGGPKALTDSVNSGRTADPDKILDQIERALDRGTTVLLPGEARITYLLRRLSPSLMWRLANRMNRV